MDFHLRDSNCQLMTAPVDSSFASGDGSKQKFQMEGFEVAESNCQFQELRCQALCDLALWSHPAWIQPRPHSIYTTAAMQWVAYHRTCTAAQRVTVAEVIGGVKGVIPQSRLATYGDFQYDIDFEDLYVDDHDKEDEHQKARPNVNHSSCASDPEFYLSASANEVRCIDQLYKTFTRKSTTPTVHTNKDLHEWLTKVRKVLVAAKRIAHFYNVFHSQTDALLKTCLKFVADALRNSEVSELAGKHAAFFVAYEDLLREPVHKIELQSIPQPVETGALDEDDTGLWLRLASMEVRRLWPENTRAVYPHEQEHSFLNERYPLIWLNFLRRGRGQRAPDADVVRVPKAVEGGLLTESLLEVLEDPARDATATKTMGGPGGDSSPRFPQAHGEWTKSLFPRRPTDQQPDKGQRPAKSVSSAGEAPVSAKGVPVAKTEARDRPPVVGSPLKFLNVVQMSSTPKGVPSSPASGYSYCQARQVLPSIPRNTFVGCSPQKQQFIVPRVPVGYMPVPMSPPITLPPPSYVKALSQRRGLQMLQNQQVLRLCSPKTECNQNLSESSETAIEDSISEIPLPPSQLQSDSAKAESQEDPAAKGDNDLASSIQSKKLAITQHEAARYEELTKESNRLPPIYHQSARPFNGLPMLSPQYGILGAQNDAQHQKHFRLGVSHYLESNFLRCRMLGLPQYLATAGRDVSPKSPDLPGTASHDKVEKWLESNEDFFRVVPLEDIAEDAFFGGNFLPPKAPRRKKADGRLMLPCHSLARLKKGSGRLEDKIEFFKRLFAEARLEERSSRSEPDMSVKRRMSGRKRSTSSRARKPTVPLGVRKGWKVDAVDQGRLPRISSDCLSYRKVAVENREFNSFPSKRVKQDAGFVQESVQDASPTRDMDEAVASLDRCARLVHEVLFPGAGQFSCKLRSAGWESFELAVRTVLENLTILVRNRHAAESQYRSIKV